MPISRVPTMAVTMVAIMEASTGIFAVLRIAGFTTMMYDMVTKVVMPATISRVKLVPARANLKYRLMAVNIAPRLITFVRTVGEFQDDHLIKLAGLTRRKP